MFSLSYDAGSDVMYVTFQAIEAASGKQDRYGLVWRFANNGRLAGVTILDLYDRWHSDPKALESRIASADEIGVNLAHEIVDRAMREAQRLVH